MLTIGNVVSPHETSASLKVCPKELTPQKRLNHFSISVVQECSAIKKGLLWEQQQNRFFFNRWKERFFILTPDYLTCFKKGSKKVGMSEMGSFVYKINLNDIKNLNWVDKKKNGVIGVQLANTVIFLWNNADTILDEWMTVLQNSTLRTKDRRETIRKSATLLPNLMRGDSSSKSINNEDLMIKKNDSSNLCDIKEPTSDNGSLKNVIPPPPPPRRYLRCLSTDLGMTAPIERDIKIPSTTTTTITSTSLTPLSLSRNTHSPIINQTFSQTKPEKRESFSSSIRKSSDTSTASSLMSQSLRCKSSYSIQYSPLMNNSPTQIHQRNQRCITSKRLSAFHQQQQQQSNESNSNSKYFQAADSEFTFVNSKAAILKSNIVDYNNIRIGHATTTDRNSNHIRNNCISSSASLVLNHRIKNKSLGNGLETPPPPVPPHRTHLHHF